MIKKIRRKFIWSAMLSISVVLLLIIGGINVANYININKTANFKLKLIADNGGRFPDLLFSQDQGRLFFAGSISEDENPPVPSTEFIAPGFMPEFFEGTEIPEAPETPNTPASNKTYNFLERDLARETAFDTRYFTVTINSNGDVSTVDTGNIFAIDSDTASSYASDLYKRGKTDGRISNYKYTTAVSDGSTMYIFLDCEREFSNVKSYLWASVGTSIIGLILVFILVSVFSKRITKPMAESYEKQKRFITDASHELKTPLTIIEANTEVIEMTSGENEWTTSTRKQVKRLASLTEKLVFLSRMDEENTRLEMTDFCISDAILDTVEPFKAVAASTGKKLSINVEPDIRFHGDEKTIRQLFSLLSDNAMKYSSENGEIKIDFHTNGKKKIFTIWNTVDEIDPEKCDMLFDRFYRIDSSHNSETGGFGIGLSVAYAIVNSHKGTITARSDDGKSIFFTVTL